MTIIRHGDLSPSNNRGHATNTDVPAASTNRLTTQASASPSPHVDIPDPRRTAEVSSNLKPLSYFKYHHEDRLVGAFAGLESSADLEGHQTPNGCADPPLSKTHVSSHHTQTPTATRAMQDELVFGIGAWAKGQGWKHR